MLNSLNYFIFLATKIGSSVLLWFMHQDWRFIIFFSFCLEFLDKVYLFIFVNNKICYKLGLRIRTKPRSLFSIQLFTIILVYLNKNLKQLKRRYNPNLSFNEISHISYQNSEFFFFVNSLEYERTEDTEQEYPVATSYFYIIPVFSSVHQYFFLILSSSIFKSLFA